MPWKKNNNMGMNTTYIPLDICHLSQSQVSDVTIKVSLPDLCSALHVLA